MNTNSIVKALLISVSVLLSACQKYGESSDNTPINDEQNSSLRSGFNINYLARNSWYGVADDEEQTKCLSKLTFSLNKVVNSTYYANNDGLSLESMDLLFEVENDASLNIDGYDLYLYQSHNQDEIVTDGARFFSSHDDAIAFADSKQINCRTSIPN